MKSSIGSTTGRSDISNRLRKRNRKPPACAPCRARKLRCDRTLPSCTNCLSRPEVEHCDYSNPRHSRCGSRSCRNGATTVPGPAKPPTPPAQPDADNEHASDMSDDDEERSEKASEKTMREKLERLERMIASLMESKACRSKGTGSCHGKKFKKEPQATIAEQPSGSETKSMSAAVGQRAPSTREGESVWSTLLNEKIQKWQQGLSRYQPASPASASKEDIQEKT